MIRTENTMTHCPADDTFISPDKIREVVASFGTPLLVYDEQRLRDRAKSLLSLFSQCRKHYFPLRHENFAPILSVIRDEGIGVQCQTEEELQRALDAGFPGEDILYCAMTLTEAQAKRMTELNVSLMVGSPLALQHNLPSSVYLMCRLPKRRNCPGSNEMERCGVGFLPQELPNVIELLRSKGVSSVGLALRHEGNITDEGFLGQRVQIMQTLAGKMRECGCPVDGIHIDGALGVQRNRVKLCPMDEDKAAENVNTAVLNGIVPLSLSLGRFLLEPCAIFISEILDVWMRNCPVIVTNARFSMLCLDRTDRYHHISILDRTWIENRRVCDVYGDMPIAGEWFAKNRILQLPEKGEYLILHDVGCCRNQDKHVTAVWHDANGDVSAL